METEDELKTKAVLGLFACYPSMAGLPEEQILAMLSSYVGTLQSRSSKVVSSACERLSRRAGSFPPSAGDVSAECEEIAHEEARARSRAEQPRLVAIPYVQPKPRRYTLEQLADWELAINHDSPPYHVRHDGDPNVPLRIPEGYPGAGQVAMYGYLTPKEAQIAAERRVAAAEEKRRQRERQGNFRAAAE